MAKTTKDLIRGSSDPNTVQTYTTKGFNHEGVTGSTPVNTSAGTGKGNITPQVMQENNSPVSKGVGSDTTKVKPVGKGMPEDSGEVRN